MIIPIIVSGLQTTHPNGSVSIDFTATYEGYELKDAIVGTAEYINSLSVEEIKTIKVDRFNVWYAIINQTAEE
jgi:hypothetical protein